MRLILVLLLIAVAAAASIGGLTSGAIDLVLPPEVAFRGGDRPIPAEEIGSSRIPQFKSDDGILRLTVKSDPRGAIADATIYLNKFPFETISLDAPAVAFGPVAFGRSGDVRVRVRRHLGPFTLSNVYWFSVYTESGDVAALGQQSGLVLHAPEKVWSGRVEVWGKGPTASDVQIKIDGRPTEVFDGSQENEHGEHAPRSYLWVDESGDFSGTISLPAPGSYNISASAKVPELQVPIVSEAKTILFEPFLPPLQERALILTLEPDGIRYQTRVVFKEGDPRGEAVLRGDLSETAFQPAISGEVRFNNTSYSGMSTGPVAATLRSGLIEFSQETWGVPPHAFRTGSVEIQRVGGLPAGQETIQVQVRDMSAVGISPLPTSVDDERILWSSKNTPVPRTITLRVDVPEAARDPWKISPLDLLPNPVAFLFWDLIAMIPLLWFLRVLARTEPTDASARQLRSSMVILGAFIALSSMSSLPWQVGEMVLPLLSLAGVSLSTGPFVVDREIQLYPREQALLAGYGVILFCFLVWWIFASRRGRQTTGNDVRIILQTALWWGLAFEIARTMVRVASGFGLGIGAIVGPIAWATLFAVCGAIGALLIGKLIQTGRLASGIRQTLPLGLVLFVAAVLLMLARPAAISYQPAFETIISPLSEGLFRVRNFIEQIGAVAPLLAAFLICAYLADPARRLSLRTKTTLASILFAGVLAGTGGVWALFPVPFLLALAIFPRLVLITQQRANLLRTHWAEIVGNRRGFLAQEYDHACHFVAPSSWFGLGLFGLRPEDRQKKRDYIPLKATFPDGTQLNLAELGFAVGRSDVATDNALAALRVGRWGALFFVVIYAIPSFTATSQSADFPYLAALLRVISVGGYWLVAAFFFGYFYDQIRGAAGWKKGIVVAVGVLLATEPLSLLLASTVADYSAIAIRILQTLAFFMLVGLGAFDLHSFRASVQRNIDWRAFPLLAGLSVVEAIVSIGLAAAGVAVSTAFSGQLTEVLGQVAAELIQTPQQPAIPLRP